MTRGISGGERKRLTTSEMMVGPRRVMVMDEISTGLDSATLFTIIRTLSEVRCGPAGQWACSHYTITP